MSISLPSGFVYLHEELPTIRFDIRYSQAKNIFGRPMKFYRANVPICTYETAKALKGAQEEFETFGYSLVIYDAYRPLTACKDMVMWVSESEALIEGFSVDLQKRQDLFDQGYISDRSSHCRGSTVDATIIPYDKALRSPVRQYREIDGKVIPWLDDNSLDMGTHFDFMGEQSHTYYSHLSAVQRANRDFFIGIMKKYGLINDAPSWEGDPQEWWHFTLDNEPFPETYFDFPVE